VDRRIWVAPLMDFTDEVTSWRRINSLASPWRPR